MSASARKRFLSFPPLWRLGLVVALGAAAIVAGAVCRPSRRPKTVPSEVAENALAEVRKVIELVRRSEFGKTERGTELTDRAARFLLLQSAASTAAECCRHCRRPSTEGPVTGVSTAAPSKRGVVATRSTP